MAAWTDALSSLRQAVHLEPGFIDARINLATIYASRKEWKPACEHFEIALQHSKDDWQLFHNYAVCLENAGELRKAVDAHEQALELNPLLDQALLKNARLKLAMKEMVQEAASQKTE